MPAGAPLLTLTGVYKHFGGLQVIKDLDFAVNEEETVGLIGPNGAGKSTVFNLITSIYPMTGAASSSGTRRSRASRPTRSAGWALRARISSSGRS